MLKAERLCRQENAEAEELQSPAIEDDGKGTRKKIAAGGLLALLVILMACIFSTLDNAVTMHHAAGTDIGQWPRLLLAVSGLSAGFLFDIRKRKFMAMMMYCVLLMSVICVVVLKLGGPFLIGLIVFYLSAGFFVVFFTTSFLDFARHMPTPALWAGMGRAMNNVSAALLTNASVALLVSDSNGMASIILALVLFVAVSVVIYLYTAWMPVSSGTPKDIPTDLDPQEAFRLLSELLAPYAQRRPKYSTSWSIRRKVFRRSQDGLYLSRRTCQRHIAAIYEKAGVKSRLGLYQLYIEKQRRSMTVQEGIRNEEDWNCRAAGSIVRTGGVYPKRHIASGPIAPKASRNFWTGRRKSCRSRLPIITTITSWGATKRRMKKSSPGSCRHYGE